MKLYLQYAGLQLSLSSALDMVLGFAPSFQVPFISYFLWFGRSSAAMIVTQRGLSFSSSEGVRKALFEVMSMVKCVTL